MTHALTALIGSPDDLAAFVDLAANSPPVPLSQGLVMVNIEDREAVLSDAAATRRYVLNIGDFDQQMMAGIGRAVPIGKALYIRTDYFGGAGGQEAALFDQGQLVWTSYVSDHNDEPYTHDKSPISEGLFRLGVVAGDSDEFDAIGLGDFRHFPSDDD